MQCEEVKIQVERSCLNDLDSALNELGMLASTTTSRDEYLTELYSKNYLNMLTINTRYVSNVSIGFRVRPVSTQVRYKPYKTSKERHRTRSENNDSEAPITSIACMADSPMDEVSQLKKAKSLESILAETNKNIEFSSMDLGKTLELEAVSNSIQNLRVDEFHDGTRSFYNKYKRAFPIAELFDATLSRTQTTRALPDRLNGLWGPIIKQTVFKFVQC